MTGEMVAFFFFSLLILIGAVSLVNLTKVIHMIFAVALTFLSIAGIFVLLNAEFLAAVQIIVHTGAVTILAVFGIMMTKHDDVEEGTIKRRTQKWLSLLVVVAFLATVVYFIQDIHFGSPTVVADESNTHSIGFLLYNRYVIPFEILSVLLLVALVGAVILAKEEDEA